MASIWRRTMVYLGLVDDEEYDEYEDELDEELEAEDEDEEANELDYVDEDEEEDNRGNVFTPGEERVARSTAEAL